MIIDLGNDNIQPVIPIMIPMQPTRDFYQAVDALSKRAKIMLALHLSLFTVLLVGNLVSFYRQCHYRSIQRWSVVYAGINYLHLFYYTYHLYLLSKPNILLQMAHDVGQLENQGNNQNSESDTQIVAKIEGQIKQYVLLKNKSLVVSLTLTVILAQASIILFIMIIYFDNYKLSMVPLTHFQGNCDDLLLNIGLVIFLFQMGTYVAFYVATMVMLSFLPFITLFVLGYGTRWMIRRYRLMKTARKFPIKLPDEVEGDKECAICMQAYLPTDRLKELSCEGKHHFHMTCIDEWLKVSSVCPLCRCNFQNE